MFFSCLTVQNRMSSKVCFHKGKSGGRVPYASDSSCRWYQFQEKMVLLVYNIEICMLCACADVNIKGMSQS